MRVLMVEDDTDILDITNYALRKYGHEVQVVTDGVAALECFHNSQPDVVLLDVNLPRMSGMDVCRQIRKHSSVPIIMVTAQNDEEHIIEGFESGADDYIGKPFSHKTLAMRMRVVTQRRMDAPRLQTGTTVEAAGIQVDLEGHQVRKDGADVRLTRLETRILH